MEKNENFTEQKYPTFLEKYDKKYKPGFYKQLIFFKKLVLSGRLQKNLLASPSSPTKGVISNN